MSVRDSTSDSVTLTGFAAVFDRRSEDLGGFQEKIQRGAFSNTLKQHPDILGLYMHDYSNVLGRTSAYTLELVEGVTGLRFSMRVLANDGLSDGVVKRIARRDVHQMSFGFTAGKDTWELARKPGELDVRTLIEIDRLFEISVVSIPAYPQTSVQIASGKDSGPEEKQEPVTISAERRREIEFGYRQAERIINRCQAKLES
jgi:HK97 family phage prohead protease